MGVGVQFLKPDLVHMRMGVLGPVLVGVGVLVLHVVVVVCVRVVVSVGHLAVAVLVRMRFVVAVVVVCHDFSSLHSLTRRPLETNACSATACKLLPVR